MTLLLVFAGGVVGTLLRYGLASAFPLPVTTLVINVAGALLLGGLLELLAGPAEGRRRTLRLALGSGLLGAFTTYSTLATEAVLLVRDGRAVLAVAYGLGSALAGLAAAALGVAAVRRARARPRARSR